MPKNQLQTMEFCKVNLVAVKRETDKKIFVAVKPICESMGIRFGSQWNRINRDNFLKQGISVMKIPSHGGNQDTFCLELDFLPFWLTGINPERCHADIQKSLYKFKLEAKEVLADAFLPAYRRRRFVEQRNDPSWQHGRQLLKDDNAETMESVKQFINVAIGMGQSPEKANKTYGNVHRMLYRELFGLKISRQNPLPVNFRDTLSKDHFLYLRNAMKIVEKVFSDAVSDCSDYHLPYYTALNNVKSYTMMVGGPFAVSIGTNQLELF